MFRSVWLALSALALASASQAQDQPVDRSGFALGAALSGAAISVDDSDTESGGGLELGVSYGFTPSVAVFFDLGGVRMSGEGGNDDYNLGTADLGVRYHISPAAALNPYVQAALTGQAAMFDTGGPDRTFSGAGITLGAGLQYALSPSVSFDAGLNLTGGEFTSVSQGSRDADLDGFDTRLARLSLGITAFL